MAHRRSKIIRGLEETLPESRFGLVGALSNSGLTRRHLMQGAAAILLQAVGAPFAGTDETHRQSTALKGVDAVPYRPEVLPEGVRSRFVNDVNGLRMHVLEAGFEVKDRPCVFLLHGFPELAYSWRKVMLPIAVAGFHVIVPDRRGYGRTSGGDVRFDDDLEPFGTLNQVQDVLALASAFGYRSIAAVIGHDFGSPLAAWCSLVRPDVFRSVVMMSAPFAGPPALPFNTSEGPKSQDISLVPSDPIYDELAKLHPPRKHYQKYFASREANEDMWHSPQGIHDFLRAYYHIKERGLEAERSFCSQGENGQSMGTTAPLLCYGSGQGNGGDGRARDALGGRHRRMQMAS
jgi:pimeloyl-ACP methyl ester carboxylesterase